MVGKVPLDKLPEGAKVGAKLRLQQGMAAVVIAIDDGEASIDANHHLAGKTLVFDIEIIEIKGIPQLRVETLEAGDGKTFPTKGDKCTMHYTGVPRKPL